MSNFVCNPEFRGFRYRGQQDIQGHILNSSTIKRFPLKGESVKGGSTVYSYCYAIRYVSKIIPTPGSGLICPFTAHKGLLYVLV